MCTFSINPKKYIFISFMNFWSTHESNCKIVGSPCVSITVMHFLSLVNIADVCNALVK